MFQNWDDYMVPLLRLLAEMPERGGRIDSIMNAFYSKHGHQLPDNEYKPSGSRSEPRWKHMLRWSRQYLVDMNLLDGSTRGVWRINENGLTWLAENPDATRIDHPSRLEPKQVQTERAPSSPKEPSSRKSRISPPGITLEMLELTRQGMTPEHFRQVWGPIYDQLLAEEQARAISAISDKQLLQAARQPVRRIQDFLQGRSGGAPKSEEICDWIHFCYTLELYREAAALWRFVQRDEVNAWQYERTKKIAAVCRTKT